MSKKYIALIIIGVIIVVIGVLLYRNINTHNNSPVVGDRLSAKRNMPILSPAFEGNKNISSKYTCDGTNVNPPLQIYDVPKGAQGLVLIIDDPDAPMGTWAHWLLWNINPKTAEISENNIPSGAVEGTTSSGKTGYDGPCPPKGTHRYFFKLYALDMKLNLGSDTNKAGLEKTMSGHILAESQLVGLYNRQ